jgi:hypothetical protein
MPEYFDISLIGKKTNTSKSELDVCLNQLGLSEGENNSELFGNKRVVVSHFEDEESDYDEISIGIPEQYFNRETFESELLVITGFVNSCFECNINLRYALCSYELNGYLIGQLKKIQDFNNVEFLQRFPIIYKRIFPLGQPKLEINLEAQEIFQ